MRSLIVDGYNIIHAWPELQQRLRDQGMEAARALLLQMLATHASQGTTAVTLVFDAHARRGEPSQQVIDGVTVVFGTKDLSADHIIERLAYRSARSGEAHDVAVATDDRLQRALVGAMGVASIGALTLRDDVLRSHDDVRAATRRQRTQQHHAGRIDQRLDPEVVARLERLRRGASSPD